MAPVRFNLKRLLLYLGLSARAGQPVRQKKMAVASPGGMLSRPQHGLAHLVTRSRGRESMAHIIYLKINKRRLDNG
jgi:hypothetical protein